MSVVTPMSQPLVTVVGVVTIVVTIIGCAIALSAQISRGHEAMMARMDARMDGLDARMDGIERRMDGIERRMDRIEGRMDRIENRIGSMDDRLRTVEVTLGKVVQRLTTIERVVLPGPEPSPGRP